MLRLPTFGLGTSSSLWRDSGVAKAWSRGARPPLYVGLTPGAVFALQARFWRQVGSRPATERLAPRRARQGLVPAGRGEDGVSLAVRYWGSPACVSMAAATRPPELSLQQQGAVLGESQRSRG